MGSGPRGLLIAAIVLLGIGEFAWGWHSVMARLVATRQATAVPHRPPPLPAAKAHLFTRDEANAFLARAKKAEAIADPLQRCLAYPDPPGSHWSPDAVAAFCRYYRLPVITFAEAQQLIQSGHAAELDHRLAAALQAQMTEPGSKGLLDRIYREAFRNGSFDIRPTLDAWMRESPNSAFAYAASGVAYESMAGDARGGAYMADTPQSNVDSMDKLLGQADRDLRRAIALNPQMTPAYVAMINAGGLGLGTSYAEDAARRGLAVAPDDYAIYSILMWAKQPKWGGSIGAMRQLADQAQAHAKENPLLELLQSEAPYYEASNCDCDRDTELAAYPPALDQLASTNDLAAAGHAADGTPRVETSLIYLSEALRFEPTRDNERLHRAFDLVDFDEAAWAVAEANRLITASPRNEDAFKVRGHAYEAMNDYVHAEQDFRAALALDPHDLWTLTQLGDMFVNWTHEWDKGWAIADRMIRDQPENPYGWFLRATIQERQPRAGLKDTVDYFEAHFGSDPQMREQAVRMRAALILQTHSGSKVLAAKGQSTAGKSVAASQ
ncbi:hypothetical protein ACFPPA_09980 [Rhodanobacter ginsengisoli]|uniref:DUF4034 domain-containing protein n=1 Tax=Rhodanobacter ginsengisoli TaxID=418646 RepID=A0ABW0QM82_9GAMM